MKKPKKRTQGQKRLAAKLGKSERTVRRMVADGKVEKTATGYAPVGEAADILGLKAANLAADLEWKTERTKRMKHASDGEIRALLLVLWKQQADELAICERAVLAEATSADQRERWGRAFAHYRKRFVEIVERGEGEQ